MNLTRLLVVLSLALPVSFAAASSPAKPPGDLLVVLNKSDHTASLIALPMNDVVATLPTGQGPHEVASRPTGGQRWSRTTAYAGPRGTPSP